MADLTKKAHEKTEFSNFELSEFSKCMDDPHYFLRNYFYIQHPVKGSILYKPYDYQIGLVDTYHNYRYSISILGRQMGKCFSQMINITVRDKHKNTYHLPVGIFYEYQLAKRDGKPLPDISEYKTE